MTDQALLDALDRLRGTGPEFNGFLANHGPMAAEALTQLGGAAPFPGWVDGYLPRLDSAPEVRRGIGDDDWHEHLGDEALFGDWTAYLRNQAQEMSWQDLLLRWWPRLLPGLAASATHGVIRTAHAVRSLRRDGDPSPTPCSSTSSPRVSASGRRATSRLPGQPAPRRRCPTRSWP